MILKVEACWDAEGLQVSMLTCSCRFGSANIMSVVLICWHIMQ